jgi:phospholipase C
MRVRSLPRLLAFAMVGVALLATAPSPEHRTTTFAAEAPTPGIDPSLGIFNLDHIIFVVQENRSFDHYFGYAPQVQARRLGPPRGYTQPDDAGVGHAPFELTALRSVDPPHGWDDVHAQYNGGKMDGFFRNAALRTGDGNNAIPYYTAKELPFYYSLFRNSGLCANYFCSLLGPTWPNRFYLMPPPRSIRPRRARVRARSQSATDRCPRCPACRARSACGPRTSRR